MSKSKSKDGHAAVVMTDRSAARAFAPLARSTEQACDEAAEHGVLAKMRQDFMKEIVDARNPYLIRYDAFSLMVAIKLARLAGKARATEIERYIGLNIDWLSTHIPNFGTEVPSHDTIARIISMVDSQQLKDSLFAKEDDALLTKLFADGAGNIQEQSQFDRLLGLTTVCADGQMMRSTAQLNSSGKRIKGGNNIVTILDADSYTVLYQEIAQRKNQEAVIIAKWVESMASLKGLLVTFDAINTRASLLELIDKKGGDFLVSLKSNNKFAYQAAVDAFDMLRSGKARAASAEQHCLKSSMTDMKGGKIFSKDIFVLPVEDVFTPKLMEKWPSVKSVICVHTVTDIISNGQTKQIQGDAYFISTIPCTLSDVPEDKTEEAKAKLAMWFQEKIIKRWQLEVWHLHSDMPGTFDQDRQRIFNMRFANNNVLLTKSAIMTLKKVQDISVTVHLNGKGYRDAPLPITALIDRASDPDIAVSYLNYAMTGDTSGLKAYNIMFNGEGPGDYAVSAKEAGNLRLGALLRQGLGLKGRHTRKRR